MEANTMQEAAMLLVPENAAGGDVPKGYIMPVEDRPTAYAPVAPIPVIDIGLLSGERKADSGDEETAKLRSALESWGIFMVTNHGVEPRVIDAMCSASREFFQRPLEEKMKYSQAVDGDKYEDYHQGYGGKELKLEHKSTRDWVDRMFLQVEPQDHRQLHLWPESFRDVLHEYFVQQSSLVNKSLLPAMARLLGFDDDFFVEKLQGRALTFARLSHYPSCPRPDLVLGVKSHTDATVVTVLMVDNNVSGLQVLKDDVWYDVPSPPDPHALLIFVGDTTEMISSGNFKASVHRVVTNAQNERTSVAMFYVPSPEEIAPADDLVNGSSLHGASK
uniref:Uncharacterized protein n=1 Tax=Avena sativa TaxID=4498 RepID=A0ACD5T905_AVESA